MDRRRLKIFKTICFHLVPVLFVLNVNLFSQDWSQSRVLKNNRLVTVKGIDEIIVQEWQDIIITRKSDIYLGYDGLRETDFIELSDLEASIWNAEGELLKELDEDEIKENSISYYAVYSDHIKKYHELSATALPYRIKKYKKYKIRSNFFWPDWDPQKDVDVDNAELEVILEGPYEFKYKNIGPVEEPQVSIIDEGNKRYSWKIKNVPAYINEYKHAPEAAFQYGVKFMPHEFELDEYKGMAESWEDFGSWGYSLFNDQTNFSSAINYGEHYHAINDTIDRIRTIYQDLQEKTRYVQIYLGIDGWRPHHVDNIDRVKYGDCKDLSVYMIAILKQAGIKAYPGLVMTRNKGITDSSFPANEFNHCLAVVPMHNDTLYLECTSDVTSIRDLHENIEGVNVLLVKPDNSKLVKTPQSSASMNASKLKATATIKTNRSLSIKGQISYTGNLAINFRSRFQNMEMTKKKEWLQKKLSANSGEAKIKSFEITGLENPGSPLYVNFSADIKYFARKAGSKLLFLPTIFHSISFDGEEPEKRKMPLLNSTRFTFVDSIDFIFPADFKMKVSSFSDSLVSIFGNFSTNIQEGSGSLQWSSAFNSNVNYVPLEDYPPYYDFMENVKKKTKKKIVLERKNKN